MIRVARSRGSPASMLERWTLRALPNASAHGAFLACDRLHARSPHSSVAGVSLDCWRARWRCAGRRGDVGLLGAARAACRETGGGQAIFIRGEAGIGKTRLIEEVQRKAIEA